MCVLQHRYSSIYGSDACVTVQCTNICCLPVTCSVQGAAEEEQEAEAEGEDAAAKDEL